MNCLLWQTSMLAVPSYLYYLISYHPLINTYPILSVLNFIFCPIYCCVLSSPPGLLPPCPSGPTRILMHHVPCCTTSCPVQSPPCRVVHAHAYHCLTGPPLKTTPGYVVDLPATSIVQSYHYHYTVIKAFLFQFPARKFPYWGLKIPLSIQEPFLKLPMPEKLLPENPGQKQQIRPENPVLLVSGGRLFVFPCRKR